MLFDPENNRYVSAGLLRAQEEAALRLLQEKREASAAAEAALLQQQLEYEVIDRVYFWCSELAESDAVAAYTNALCVESFKANGLPDQ